MTTYWDRAMEAAQTARRNRDEGDINGAGNRAYYAVFYAIQALFAISDAAIAVKTHASVIRLFHERFIATGKVPDALARALTGMQNLRSKADYTQPGISPGEAAEAIEAMDDVLEHIGKLLRNREEGTHQ